LCKKILKKEQFNLRALAKVLRNINWAKYAVRFAPAHYRYLQAFLISQSRIKNNLDAVVSPDNGSLIDLVCWVNEANFSKGKSLLSAHPDVYLSFDGSRTGSAAVCLDMKIGGPWTSFELELQP
jgi:hypothetical protein